MWLCRHSLNSPAHILSILATPMPGTNAVNICKTLLSQMQQTSNSELLSREEENKRSS
jgi:hypothetical protein